ncbi:MAG: allantoinase AllB [Acidobacteria bacterium]|nr:allantoinase AllB [Acidobacteriota bacterium]MCA1651541.1 allantoinase AllB [Acidobacteriota bacterium]
MTSLVVRSERAVLPDGVRPAAIHVRDGRIAAVAAYAERVAGVPELNAGELVVLPGLVDTHVHINDPGRADWEGFEHATRAAAAGGVTTLVDMPLNSIPSTTTARALEAKRSAAAGRCHVDVGFWGGVVPGNADALDALAHGGVLGFKCFLCPSGVDEFEHVSEKDLREAMPVLARLGLPLLAHAEFPELLGDDGRAGGADPRVYDTWLRSRPPRAEQGAIDMLIRLSREFGARVHIVHLASADAIAALRVSRAAGAAVTVETCPHYLTFAAEEIRDGAVVLKCAPPIRGRGHREGLWQGLAQGDIDLVVTDHSPAPPSLKCVSTGDFLRAWGGIASLQIGLPAVWTAAADRGFAIERLAQWMAAAPARLAGIDRSKGAIAAGRDADLVMVDPDAYTTIDPLTLHHRHKITPYAGMRLRGLVRRTLLRGTTIFHEGDVSAAASGRFVRCQASPGAGTLRSG